MNVYSSRIVTQALLSCQYPNQGSTAYVSRSVFGSEIRDRRKSWLLNSGQSRVVELERFRGFAMPNTASRRACKSERAVADRIELS